MRAANTSIKPALKIDWPNGENLNRKILGNLRPKQEKFFDAQWGREIGSN